MKISWTSLKVSIAGAKLSHLVQKDRIWDHGSMIEQAKVIFFKVHRTVAGGKIEDLKKYLTTSCYERLEKELTDWTVKGKHGSSKIRSLTKSLLPGRIQPKMINPTVLRLL